MGWKSRNTTPKPLLFQWISSPFIYVLWLGTQSCLTLCDPMDSSTPDSSVHGESPDKNIGVGCHALLQGIFPSQKSNWELFHCRRILYQLPTERQEVPLRLYTPHNWLVKNKQTNKCRTAFPHLSTHSSSERILAKINSHFTFLISLYCLWIIFTIR